MKRPTKSFTIASGGTPQPLVGTTLTAAAGPAGTDPNGDPSNQIVAVADSSMFRAGDWIVIGTSAAGDEERVLISTDIDDSTHIEIKLAKNHLNGAFVRLSVLCQSVYVQTKAGNAGIIYIGTQGLVKATGVNVIAQLIAVAATGVQPIEFSDPIRVSPDASDIGEYWVDGTTGDGYLPTLTVI